jgi:ribonuclease D
MTVPSTPLLPDGIARAISKEEIAVLPIGRYDGDVCLVQTEQDLENALEDFRQEPVVGFDIEARPSFRKGERHPPCLVQAATARAVYLFRLREQSDLRVPAELLASPGTVKVGIGLADDMRALQLLHPFEYSSMLDLGSIARRCGLEQTGVRNLAGIFLNIRILKSIKTSNWAAQKLTPAQITYAATDAWICRELFLRFRSLGMIPD